jgi:hypothetical protein
MYVGRHTWTFFWNGMVVMKFIFEGLIIWRKAIDLAKDINAVSGKFPQKSSTYLPPESNELRIPKY